MCGPLSVTVIVLRLFVDPFEKKLMFWLRKEGKMTAATPPFWANRGITLADDVTRLSV